MHTQLQHLIESLAHGLLAELPSQLVTAGIAAAAAAGLRVWRRRRLQKEASTEK
ncbi:MULTISPECIES: hypothetical protein [Streptomyces]|uniref:hypothetical protein n=1 Tax=Streptomyces TaxID=1883 RepID=UPI00161EAEBE|nr:hypothetical protein [Streptomyces sp. 2132.2]